MDAGLADKYDEVPWFSRAEWEEVYKNIFGSNCEEWVNAFYHLSMWKVRIPRLPVGIACTIPLVEAQIALADPFGSSNPLLRKMDEAFRSTIFNRCISRFVTLAAECFEERYTVGKRMADVAEAIKLPIFLVDIRNRLTHDDSDFVSPETRHHALDLSLQWIKVNYWDTEVEKFEPKKPVKAKRNKNLKRKPIKAKRNTNLKRKPDTEILSCKRRSKKLRAHIEDRVAYITTHCDDFTIDEKEEKCIYGLNAKLQLYASKFPEDAMNILVSELFLSPLVIARIQKKPNQYHSPMCKSKHHSLRFIFRLMIPHLEAIVTMGAINMFINAFIELAKGDCRSTAMNWIKVFASACCKGSLEHRIFKKFSRVGNIGFLVPVDWKQHAYTLIKLGEYWSLSLGFELRKKKLITIRQTNIKKLYKLILIYKGKQRSSLNGLIDKKPKSVKANMLSENILNLEDVIKKARKLSPHAYEYVKELSNQVRGICEEENENENGKDDAYLGVLPHQVGDERLYKKLILSDSDAEEMENRCTETSCPCSCH